MNKNVELRRVGLRSVTLRNVGMAIDIDVAKHEGHYITLNGLHYKTSDGLYYTVKG